MNVKGIIKAYLVERGFDGLCLPGQECGCTIADLFPCENVSSDCQAGHLAVNDDEKLIIIPGEAEEKEMIFGLWRIGDIWRRPGAEDYILARTIHPDIKSILCFQFIGLRSGNRYSDAVVTETSIPAENWDSVTLPAEKVAELMDNPEYAAEAEKCHVYGWEWKGGVYD